MLNIIICGAPGSGKGTQSDKIVEKYQLAHLSTGDLLRAEIASGSELGKEMEAIISQGQLVPDQMMVDILSKAIDQLPADCKGVIFDGFPRNVAQAEILEQMLAQRGEQTAMLLDLQVEEEELVSRLLNRGKTSGRSDDNLDTIKQRLKVYHEKTQPVSLYYRDRNKYKGVHGMGTPEEIFSRIDALLHEHLS